jgi:hypothetical protein
VYDLKKLLHKRKERIKNLVCYLDMNLYFPKYGVKSIDNLDFDLLFEQTMFRSRSKSYLNEIIFDKNKFQYLIPTNPPQATVIPTQTIQPIQIPPRSMAAKFSPLALPTQLHDLPQSYNQRIKSYNVEGNASSQKHLDWFNDFVDLEEVDYEDAKKILFAQSLSGEVGKWFKSLPTTSIPDFVSFKTLFLARWDDKKNPL